MAKQSDLLAHACTHATLTIGDIPFCFNTRNYFYKSNDTFRKVLVPTLQKHSISSIFIDSDIAGDKGTNGERLEYIMNYGPDKVVFMTLSYLLIFNRNLFAAKPVNDSYLLELTVKRNLTADQYKRTANCLFTRCSYRLMDLIKGDRPFELFEIMDEENYVRKNDTDLDEDLLELTRLTSFELEVLAKGNLNKVCLFSKFSSSKFKIVISVVKSFLRASMQANRVNQYPR